MSERKRWERQAEAARHRAPGWLDLDRLAWWPFAITAAVAATRALYLLLDGGRSWGERLAAVVLLVLVAPTQALAARRRQRGEPLFRNSTRSSLPRPDQGR
jgi:hypothetical protein